VQSFKLKKKKIKILIIEKSDIIRQGLAALLTAKNNTPLIVEQCNGESEIKHSIHKSSPQILIASPSVFKQNEKQITSVKEKSQILLVAFVYSYHDPDSLKYYDGIIYLNDKAKKIQANINDLLKPHTNSNSTSQSEALTGREKEVLKLLVSGNTTKQIATTLFISTHTVNTHRKNIMRKLDIKTVSGLTIFAVLNNIITLKEV